MDARSHPQGWLMVDTDGEGDFDPSLLLSPGPREGAARPRTDHQVVVAHNHQPPPSGREGLVPSCALPLPTGARPL